MSRIKLIAKNKVLVVVLLALLATVLSIQNLVFYLRPNTSLFVFLAITPFVLTIKKGDRNIRFAWVSLSFLLLYFFFKMQLLFFFSFSSFILFLIESKLGKTNSLPLFIILLISPYSLFIFDVFGFPIRLILTDIAAFILSFVADGAVSSGNNIIIEKQSYSVDPECMGLTMVGYGYATTLLFIGFFEKKFNRKISIFKIIGMLTISTAFIIAVNLFRIVTIVLLHSKPDTISHEIIGLLSFGVYFILPIYFISSWIIHNGKQQDDEVITLNSPNKTIIQVFTLVIILLLTFFNINRDNYRNIQEDSKSNKILLNGFQKSTTSEKVIKFENDTFLVYVKPSCHFFAPDHSPTICWKGSGYEFVNIKTEQIGSNYIYTAELTKGTDTLQTAWWFDNGQEKTIGQLDWRWNAFLGSEPYRLVNVTSVFRTDLNTQVSELLEADLFTGVEND